MSLDGNKIYFEDGDDSDVDNNDLPNAIVLQETSNITEATKVPNYMPCIFEGNVQQEMTIEEQQLCMTIDAHKRAFIASENVGDISQQYVCEILEIKVTTDRYVYYHLKYDKSEAEKRDPLWLPQWKVAHQENYGRSYNSSAWKIIETHFFTNKKIFQ